MGDEAMTDEVSLTDLMDWQDPDRLLEALYGLPREPQPELRPAVARLLEHGDPDIREEALRVLVTRWKDQTFREHAIEKLRSDPAPTVRSAAAYGLTGVSSAASRADDVGLLLERLGDPSEDLEVRGAAYDALLIIHRRPAFPSRKRAFDPERDVDWAWINEVRESGG